MRCKSAGLSWQFPPEVNKSICCDPGRAGSLPGLPLPQHPTLTSHQQASHFLILHHLAFSALHWELGLVSLF